MRSLRWLLVLATVPAAAGAQAAPPPATGLDFSGVIYANYQRRTDSLSKAANAGNAASKFDVERVYLNFRLPVGERASIRVTTDVLNNTNSATNGYYGGWTARLKYAYLQMNFANNIAGVSGLNGTARIGMLHNVVIDHEESYWARYLSQVALERTAGFFSSADLGAALLVTLPKKLGEVYAVALNGPGYTAAENDRFKDFGARLTLTPLANGTALGAWGKTLAITPWFYSGQTASKFQNGGAGQVGRVEDGLTRDRYGVFVGARDPRLTAGVSYGQRTETAEGGLNTAAEPRTTSDVSGQVTSFFGVVRPGLLAKASGRMAKVGLLGRIDQFTPNTDADPSVQLSIFSLFYEPNAKVTFSLDAQTLSRKNGSTANEFKGLFLHVQAVF